MTDSAARQDELRRLDEATRNVPFTHDRVCHLLYDLTVVFADPTIVEVSYAYGKATAYLAAGARQAGGTVLGVDLVAAAFRGRTAAMLLDSLDLGRYAELTTGEDARWYLLDLVASHEGPFIDLAYLDLSHTVEVDAFVAVALWNALKPGGLLVFDDLDWLPAVHGPEGEPYSRSRTPHVAVIFDYVSRLPDVALRRTWGSEEVCWTWGFLQKTGGSRDAVSAVKRVLDEHSGIPDPETG